MRCLTRCLLFGFALAGFAIADVRLPSLISDHMVLQRGVPVRIWGWADPGETVTVAFLNQQSTVNANFAGKWETWLAPMDPGGPANLTVIGNNALQILDVLIGEVWVASGQSNMEFPLYLLSNAVDEIYAAQYPQIRFFLVHQTVADAPAEDVQGSWVLCAPGTVWPESAAAYFFAREIFQTQQIPVAVINSYWGATGAQSWTALPVFQSDPSLGFFLTDWQASGALLPPQNKPAALYNAMIAPLTPFSIRGVLWYQGESNAGSAQAFVYRRLLSGMIEDWRRAWGMGEFPFYLVQLANFNANGWWPLLRESQSAALALKNTAMAVTIDIGDPNNVHPDDKRDVGHRLALPARALVYGETISYSGPMFRQAVYEGSIARIFFDFASGGLASRDGLALTGFEIASSNGVFVPATAFIDGATIVVSALSISKPAMVRYAWADNPAANLINSDGLPASPFRTPGNIP